MSLKSYDEHKMVSTPNNNGIVDRWKRKASDWTSRVFPYEMHSVECDKSLKHELGSI